MRSLVVVLVACRECPLLWNWLTQNGKAPWGSLFEQAAVLAEHGFFVSERLSGLLEQVHAHVFINQSKILLFPNGEPLAHGEVLINHEYANLMQQLADHGSGVFYFGSIAVTLFLQFAK